MTSNHTPHSHSFPTPYLLSFLVYYSFLFVFRLLRKNLLPTPPAPPLGNIVPPSIQPIRINLSIFQSLLPSFFLSCVLFNQSSKTFSWSFITDPTSALYSSSHDSFSFSFFLLFPFVFIFSHSSSMPTVKPSLAPSSSPTKSPTQRPTIHPTLHPTFSPSTLSQLNLVYNNGLIMTSTETRAIFWGTSWASTTYQGTQWYHMT